MAKIGLNGKLHYSATLMGAIPVWTLFSNVRDLTLSLEAGEADVSTRASRFKMFLESLIDATVEWESVWDPSDTTLTALRTAFLAGNAVALAIMDDLVATSGAQGLQADFIITQFGRNEPLADGMMVPITAKPAYSTTPPAWATTV